MYDAVEMIGIVKAADDATEYLSTEGCHLLELSNGAHDPAVSIARARVAPGVTTRWHRLRGTVERYVIISGTGRVEIGGLPSREVRAGDTVIIPPLCPQRITNTGPSDLVFLAICTPRFSWDIYEDIDAAAAPESGSGESA
jgi:mannose-6-phosphate isomerase-like protein (cupin superfamily)